jgi:hypothetical protein
VEQTLKEREALRNLGKTARQVEKESLKKKERKPSKDWNPEVGLEFPIHMFDYKGNRVTKIHDKEEMTMTGVSHVSMAVSLREKTMFRGVYFSYNKKIDLAQYLPTQLRAI